MLHVHRAERADRLVEALAQILATPPADPFAPELIAVPTRGMERWLTQRLSAHLGAGADGDGVCANVEFPFPGRLVAGALATASGIEPDEDPWRPERMVWPLIHTIEDNLDQPWLAPLASHLDQGRERRLAHVREIARLFDGYSFSRPELVLAWAAGHDAPAPGARLSGSGTGNGAGWQPELWRCLRERIGVPSGAERLDPACRRLREDPELIALPERLSVFGLTRLPPSYLGVLHALAAARELHLFLLHPSPVLWQRVAELVADPPRRLRRAEDPTARLPTNRLLASWGRDSRELQLVLAGGGATTEHHHPLEDPPPATLLGHLQAAVRADRQPPGPPLPDQPDERLPLEAADDSLRVHACHGRQRQVEVLREAILHRLAADPTLEPRDVIVMCPDIETFAPLIHAAFGGGREAEDELGELAPVDLRVRLADRALRQTNPVLGVVARLLDLARARVTASELLDLADSPPVRRRFALDDDDLARIGDWIVASGIHWGLGPRERQEYGLSIEEGTWRAGLRRVLLGAGMSEDEQRMFGGVLPVDDVDSGDIDLAGRFAELVDRLAVALGSLSGPHTVAGWAEALARAADALTATSDADARQQAELRRILDELADEASAEAATLALELPEIRALLADRLAGRPTRANFRTGHLTICTLVPMRSVPHRVVCLLGLDDGAFPRRTPRHGDDLRLADPLVGDRDPRAEDRQLLLDALLAAQDAVIVTYSGHDERTNAKLPPAVPIGELLDAVDAAAVLPEAPDQGARSRVLISHPLQPFDPRNFAPGQLCRTGPWSFDRVALAGAQALEAERRPTPPFVSSPLPPVSDTSQPLADLIAFVERPVQAFLRQRLGVATGSFEDEVDDALPVELDGLGEWGVGQRLLEAVLAGAGGREACLAEVARGKLPPGALGRPVIARVWPEVRALVDQALAHAGSDEPRSLETNFRLPRGAAGGEFRVTGTVTGVYGRVVLSVAYSRLAPKHRLAAWVRMLALTAAHPDVPFEAVTIGRAEKRADASLCVAHIPALGSAAESRRARALAELALLAELRALGLREPLPLPCATGAAWSEAIVRRRAEEVEARRAACGEWESRWRFPKEDAADEHVLAFGPGLGIDDLLSFTSRDGDPGERSETRRFVRLADALWRPLLSAETVSSL